MDGGTLVLIPFISMLHLWQLPWNTELRTEKESVEVVIPQISLLCVPFVTVLGATVLLLCSIFAGPEMPLPRV